MGINTPGRPASRPRKVLDGATQRRRCARRRGVRAIFRARDRRGGKLPMRARRRRRVGWPTAAVMRRTWWCTSEPQRRGIGTSLRMVRRSVLGSERTPAFICYATVAACSVLSGPVGPGIRVEVFEGKLTIHRAGLRGVGGPLRSQKARPEPFFRPFFRPLTIFTRIKFEVSGLQSGRQYRSRFTVCDKPQSCSIRAYFG